MLSLYRGVFVIISGIRNFPKGIPSLIIDLQGSRLIVTVHSDSQAAVKSLTSNTMNMIAVTNNSIR